MFGISAICVVLLEVVCFYSTRPISMFGGRVDVRMGLVVGLVG